jgi:formylglycine-generating enzyme required for sulfatase activity
MTGSSHQKCEGISLPWKSAFKVQEVLELTPNDQAMQRLQARLPRIEREIVNSIGMKFAMIRPGRFLMGSPAGEAERGNDEQQHEVAITRPFYLGVFPVTQAQWRAVMGNNPSYCCATGGGKDSVRGMNTDDFPVEQVSWEDAQSFLDALAALKKEREAGRKYRLPTEAEWEYSCRGGASSYQIFHFGNSLSSTQANFDGRYPYGGAAAGPYLGRTCKVGSYKPNAFGLYDTHGNVWEWCADWYGDYAASPERDPAGPPEGSGRVFRGGSWKYLGRNCRSALRCSHGPGERYDYLGFRAALVPSGG